MGNSSSKKSTSPWPCGSAPRPAIRDKVQTAVYNRRKALKKLTDLTLVVPNSICNTENNWPCAETSPYLGSMKLEH